MRPPIRILLNLALITILFPAPASSQTGEIIRGEEGRALDGYLSRLEGVGFSGVVLAARDGQVILEKGYGYADREADRSVTAATVFTIGSITKQFTGAAILKLEMMGSLSTDDSITKYFSDVPPDKQGITLHHLLTHSAGLPGAIGDDFDITATADRFTELAMGTELRSAPGQQYEYSNVGFSLLGIIVEKVSGLGYEEFLRRNLFEPAGMTRTGYLLPDYTDEELATGYRNGNRWGSVVRKPMLPDGPGWHLRANGGIHSTAGDMYRWYQALQGDQILSSEAKEKYFAPHVDEGGGQSFYGYGWSIVPDYMGRRLITHNGGNGIFTADFRNFVDDEVMIFTASNLSTFAPVDYVTRDLSRLIFGAPLTLPPETISLTEEVLDGYAGIYRMPDEGLVEVERVGGHLLMRGSGKLAGNLLAGGSGATDDPAITRYSEQSADILRRALAGDFTGIHEAFGDRMPLEQIEAEERGWMEMREQRYGEYRDLEVVSATRAGMRVTVHVGIEYERGTGFIRYVWGGGELMGIELVPGLPGAEADIYPLSPTAFESFSLQSPVRVKIEFELDEQSGEPIALLFVTGEEKVRADKRTGGRE